jgi:hypothetical protein
MVLMPHITKEYDFYKMELRLSQNTFTSFLIFLCGTLAASEDQWALKGEKMMLCLTYLHMKSNN